MKRKASDGRRRHPADTIPQIDIHNVRYQAPNAKVFQLLYQDSQQSDVIFDQIFTNNCPLPQQYSTCESWTNGVDFIIQFATIHYMQKEQKEQAIAGLYQFQSSKHGETTEGQTQMNIETNLNLTKKKRIIFWAYLFAILAFAITITILAAKSWTPTHAFLSNDSYYYAYQVTQDWQLGYIIDVKVVNGSVAACPAGYENAINYTWSGSNFGCYCSPSGNLSFVLEGFCSPALIQSGCQNLVNQPSFTVNNWVNYGRICLKRSTVTFANEQRYSGTNVICGNSQSLVIMPNTNCPFVNISFTPFVLEDHYATVNDPSAMLNPLYVSYNSTSPYSFYSYPLIRFAVSQFQFCQMTQDTGINPFHSDYILLKDARGCATTGNFTLLDSQTQITFYQYNPQLQALTSIPGFPDPTNFNYLFGFASLPGWTYSCRHNLQGKFSIPKAIDQFSFAYQTQYKNFLIGVTVCLVVILLELIILTLRRIVNNAIYPVGYKQRYLLNHFLWAMVRYVVDWSAKLTLLGLTLGNIFTIYTNYNWFKSAINLNCADNNYATINSVLTPFLELYTQLYRYALAALVVCIAMIVVDFIHFCYIYRNELAFYLVESADKQMVKREDSEQLKWVEQKELFEAKDVEGEAIKQDNDEFRITMAQNVFAREETEQPQKLKKKKKKKIPSYSRRKDQQMTVEGQKADETLKILQEDSGFNPYSLDQDPLDSLQLNSPVKNSTTGAKRRRKF